MKMLVREMERKDIPYIVSYWLESDPDFLKGMGVDLAKLPTSASLEQMLQQQLALPIKDRMSYALIWECDGMPVGHCNVNPITYGASAYMHLHLWQAAHRKKGMGTAFVKASLPYFFEKLELEVLFSEPYAENTAPHKTLKNLGFRLEKTYVTTPGSLNFEQKVHRWSLNKTTYVKLK